MKKPYWKPETDMHFDAPPKLFEFALKNRHNPTKAEQILWEALKGNSIAGNKFRRQHPVGKYIIDFYCHKHRLAVEIDGGYHLTAAQRLHDAQRTAALNQLGIREIRFTNEDVLNDLWGVLEGIWGALGPVPPADPLPPEGGVHLVGSRGNLFYLNYLCDTFWVVSMDYTVIKVI